MLTTLQLSKLSVEDRNRYEELLRENDTESLSQFEYFFGFTITTDTILIPSNAEIDLYKNFTDKVKLKHIAQMLGFVPHAGQQNIFYTIDERRDIVNNIVMCLGRRSRKKCQHIRYSGQRASCAIF